MKKTIILALVLVICASCAFAAPFGIEIGWTLDDLIKNGIRFNNYPDESFVALLPPFDYYGLPYYFADYDADGIYCVSACSEDITTSTSEGLELWTYFTEIIKDFNSFYGLPHLCIDYYASKTYEKPSYFMSGLGTDNIKECCVWFVDDLAIFLNMYADSENVGLIACEIWRYKDVIDYFNQMKTDYKGIIPQTKADIPWSL